MVNENVLKYLQDVLDAITIYRVASLVILTDMMCLKKI